MGLDGAIREIVEKAISSGEVLRIYQVAEQLSAAHPDCGLDFQAIAAQLFEAGVKARVPLEWDHLRS